MIIFIEQIRLTNPTGGQADVSLSWPPGRDIAASNWLSPFHIWMEQKCTTPHQVFFPPFIWKKRQISPVSTPQHAFKAVSKWFEPTSNRVFSKENPFFFKKKIIIIVSLSGEKSVKNPLLSPFCLHVDHHCKSQRKTKKIQAVDISTREWADNGTYIGMMLGMRLLRAAAESEYPQSWACLNRHADSLCRWAPVFKPPSSRHTVVVTRVTPNWARTCCRDARIIKSHQAYL